MYEVYLVKTERIHFLIAQTDSIEVVDQICNDIRRKGGKAYYMEVEI